MAVEITPGTAAPETQGKGSHAKSLAIESDDVIGVLLEDGWHEVEAGSFDLDSYEFMWEKGLGPHTALHPGGQSGVCATGFRFYEGGSILYGPLTSVRAVRTVR